MAKDARPSRASFAIPFLPPSPQQWYELCIQAIHLTQFAALASDPQHADLIDRERVRVDHGRSSSIALTVDFLGNIVLNHYNMSVITTRIITLEEPEDHEQS
jgi:hypothetical protein